MGMFGVDDTRFEGSVMLKARSFLAFGSLLFLAPVAIFSGSETAKIIKMSGEVKVRAGLNEHWDEAHIGMLLRDIDTILTTEAAEVVLKLASGETFHLESNAVVDVGDLRKISERELFLFLMSQKMDKIKAPDGKAKLRITNVSVVRAENKAGGAEEAAPARPDGYWRQETNGARSMYEQDFFPNAIMKFHKILQKYPELETCSEIYFYLAKSFEHIDEPGRALEAYRLVLALAKQDACGTLPAEKMISEATDAIRRLKD